MLTNTIHAADWAAKRVGVGFVPPVVPDWPAASAREAFDLTETSVARLESEIRAEFLDGDSLRGLGRAA
jgi:hypothetical protein